MTAYRNPSQSSSAHQEAYGMSRGELEILLAVMAGERATAGKPVPRPRLAAFLGVTVVHSERLKRGHIVCTGRKGKPQLIETTDKPWRELFGVNRAEGLLMVMPPSSEELAQADNAGCG